MRSVNPESATRGDAPSVASETLTNGVERAMTKHHSHSFREHFSTECCAKNTQMRMAPPKARDSRRLLPLRPIFSCKFKMLQKSARAAEWPAKGAAAILGHYIRSKTDEFGPISTHPTARKAHFPGNRSPRTNLTLTIAFPAIDTNDRDHRNRHQRLAASIAAAESIVRKVSGGS